MGEERAYRRSQARLLEMRRRQFVERYIGPMIAEAERLGLDAEALVSLIRETSNSEKGVKV